jgi:hypothetical protein
MSQGVGMVGFYLLDQDEALQASFRDPSGNRWKLIEARREPS